VTLEIPGSPVSRHDLDVIREQLNRARLKGLEPSEIIVSAQRIIVALGLRVAGVPLRVSAEYALNDGAIIVRDHPPELFDFEAET
jgi:hypothetical protein